MHCHPDKLCQTILTPACVLSPGTYHLSYLPTSTPPRYIFRTRITFGNTLVGLDFTSTILVSLSLKSD